MIDAPNPFAQRQGIRDAGLFYGRAELTRVILELAASGQSCAVRGERRIGKTSFLAYVRDPRVLAAHGLDASRTACVEIDFLAFGSATPNEVWREILDALYHVVDEAPLTQRIDRVRASDPITFAEVRRVLNALTMAAWRLVILCDELEWAVQNPALDLSFFGALRSLASGQGVVFITASRYGLLELDRAGGGDARREILASPFFNIFAERDIGAFEAHEVAALLAGQLEGTQVRFDASDIDVIERSGGRHPYFVQLLAYHLYDAHRAGIDDPLQRAAWARGRATPEAAKVFQNFWSHSSDRERGVLEVLATGSSLVDGQALAELERRALVRRHHDHATVFSDLFSAWIVARE
ncbi:MAG: ATP-binding protein [Acidobacteriota bacterium]